MAPKKTRSSSDASFMGFPASEEGHCLPGSVCALRTGNEGRIFLRSGLESLKMDISRREDGLIIYPGYYE